MVSADHFAGLEVCADLIVGSEVRTPAAMAFDVIFMKIIEPNPKALLSRQLSPVVLDAVVDCDLPLRDGPDIPWEAGSVSRSRYLPLVHCRSLSVLRLARLGLNHLRQIVFAIVALQDLVLLGVQQEHVDGTSGSIPDAVRLRSIFTGT
jgi:hypothetical protein